MNSTNKPKKLNDILNDIVLKCLNIQMDDPIQRMRQAVLAMKAQVERLKPD